MKIHKNARLTFARRLEMVRNVVERGIGIGHAAGHYGVSMRTVRKWVHRYSAEGPGGLEDRTSRPARSPRATQQSMMRMILDLRHGGRTMKMIAAQVGRSLSTVSRVCADAGLSQLPKNGAPAHSVTEVHRKACTGSDDRESP